MDDDVKLCALMADYQAGRFEAFDEIYALVAPRVRRFLLGKVREATKADDLLQDTFLQIHRARHTFDPAHPLMPWAMAIARHVWLMDLRAASRRPRPTDDVTAIDLPVAAAASSFAERADVRRALVQVPSSRRRAAIEHHVWGLSFKEIAERAGIAEAAAKLRSSRGIAQLRSLLKAADESRTKRG